MRRTLIIINYSMSKGSQVFAHQRNMALRLSSNFRTTHIITLGDYPEDLNALPQGINLIALDWPNERSYVRRIVSLYRAFFRLINQHPKKELVVFCHMTDVVAALIGPFTRALGLYHVLWYAHKKKSLYLRVAHTFVNLILTSTEGSCPYKGKKTIAIGQGVDASFFRPTDAIYGGPPSKFLFVGRLDPSKNLKVVFDAFEKILAFNPNATLRIIGTPIQNKDDSTGTIFANHPEAFSKSITYLGSLDAVSVRKEYASAHALLHAYKGSLDKVLIEAAMMNIIVFTLNEEFRKDFLIDTLSSDDNCLDLFQQYISLITRSPEEILQGIAQNRFHAIDCHSLESWLIRTRSILVEAK